MRCIQKQRSKWEFRCQDAPAQAPQTPSKDFRSISSQEAGKWRGDTGKGGKLCRVNSEMPPACGQLAGLTLLASFEEHLE